MFQLCLYSRSAECCLVFFPYVNVISIVLSSTPLSVLYVLVNSLSLQFINVFIKNHHVLP